METSIGTIGKRLRGTISTKGSRASFSHRASGMYQDTAVNLKTLPVKILHFDRKDLIELKWVHFILLRSILSSAIALPVFLFYASLCRFSLSVSSLGFYVSSNGPITIAIRIRFECDSSTIRARFDYEAYEMPTIRVLTGLVNHVATVCSQCFYWPAQLKSPTLTGSASR